MGHTAVQPVGSSAARDPEVWMSSVTDTCSPLSLLGFLPQYFHGRPCAECRCRGAVPQGQMDTDGAFPGHPCMDPPPLALGGASGAQSHGTRSLSPRAKLTGSICCLLGHLQCQQGPGAPSLCCCLFLVFHEVIWGKGANNIFFKTAVHLLEQGD